MEFCTFLFLFFPKWCGPADHWAVTNQAAFDCRNFLSRNLEHHFVEWMRCC